jgi:hypothetical protein
MSLQTLDTNAEFESLVRPFLALHPEIPYEWQQIRNIWSGGRTVLLVNPNGGNHERVSVNLLGGQIGVLTDSDDVDFEDFGRGLSTLQLAQEAFAFFLQQLRNRGIVGNDA